MYALTCHAWPGHGLAMAWPHQCQTTLGVISVAQVVVGRGTLKRPRPTTHPIIDESINFFKKCLLFELVGVSPCGNILNEDTKKLATGRWSAKLAMQDLGFPQGVAGAHRANFRTLYIKNWENPAPGT